MSKTLVCWLSYFFVILSSSATAQDFSFRNALLTEVIDSIEEKTSYRFLYRESLIAAVRIDLESGKESLFSELTRILSTRSISLRIDDDRKQVLVFYNKNESGVRGSTQFDLSGFVVDDLTGERLPFSTVSWRSEGELRGISASENGAFQLQISSTADSIVLNFHSLGYKTTRVVLTDSPGSSFSGIGIRLKPEPFSGQEILIQGFNFYTQTDSSTRRLIKVGMFSPLGESNALRSLQLLPAVTLGPALSNGINVRGSAADGFRTLLDGQTMYHQSHLFGMLDAMNPDALNTSGFFYGITPARYQAPLGATLSLITRPGSLQEVSAKAGISNTAVNATMEGPISNGRASWLLSGRTSLLDQLNWFGNSDLINFGLDINRPASAELSRFAASPNVRDVSIVSSDIVLSNASFQDLHGKLYLENKDGSRWNLSGYLGSDDAEQQYQNGQDPEILRTANNWNTRMTSLSYQKELNGWLVSTTRTGLSDYNSRYIKDDFGYQLRDQTAGRFDSTVIAPLGIDNALREFSFAQSILGEIGRTVHEAGISYKDLSVEYTENSLRQLSFRSLRTTQLAELFHESDLELGSNIGIRAGSRLHYYSNGQYLRWSPRFNFTYRPTSSFKTHAGFSRNYQFIHRLAFYNINSTDVWILSNEEQPPSSVWHVTSGISVKPHPQFRMDIDLFHKSFQNLRLHELNTGFISSSFQNGNLPWFFDNEGRSMGVEMLTIWNHIAGQLSLAYTLSEVSIRNENILDGAWFNPDWDRRHQFNAVSEITIAKGLTFFTSWMLTSGVPNRIDLQRVTGNERLGNYSRIDVALQANKGFQDYEIRASFNIYNLLNRNNPWYNEVVPVQIETRLRTLRSSVLAEVYDLGFQPSFSLGFYF